MISPSHACQLLVLALFVYGIVCLRDPGTFRLLEYDQTLANPVQLAGLLLFLWAMLRASQYSTASEGAQKAALPQL